MSQTTYLTVISAIIVIVGVSCFAVGWYAYKDLHQQQPQNCMFANEVIGGVYNS